MKTLILIFLLLSSPAWATKVTISGELELGSDVKSYDAFIDVNLGLNVYWKMIKNYTYIGNTAWMVMDWGKPSAYPFRNIYYYGNRFSVAGAFVDVRHFCNHAVKSTALHVDAYGYENKEWRSNFWGETITTISIGYEFELPVYEGK